MWTNEDLDSERQSLDIELGRRLSQLSENAKFAVGLNQIQRVAVRDLYDSPEHDGATVYIMDVYIHKTQKGLPTANAGESKTDRKRRLQHQQESERPEYDVEHRYSDFRALRQRIYDIVDCTEDQLHPVCMDSLETSKDTNCNSLDMDLGRHLSQLSNSARFAVRLNQMNHVAIQSFYEHEEHGRAVTVYVVDVFLQRMQKGLPKTDRKREQQSEHPAYRVQHRYSEFRLLRQHIEDVVGDPGDDDAHPLLCPYCSRVLWLVTAGSFPSRYPNQGPVATCTGWRKLLTYSRKHSLEKFINALLGAAKDVSYRYTAIQCERYATVSHLLNDFLAEPHSRMVGTAAALSYC
ncbi:hypothetical protein BBO99_00006550 [Phytophthora kernoviae]|uniref:PX domain-containing protein n=2 Tax=Phytophthora kernoviae TaxID=325452 RepID=A0A421GL21_9STRA|nr:hypothetical protein G195_008091 [Phytophthora kernoviae 00238/432]KAG2520292.1 hypothetical protein JM16_006772 [Phytophthora kernoviae]KAG2521117.1 hypothetical protein JM18_006638 [Phytophthora kernoviae]RLN13827.1 hypothetical protein BBI17_006583 [Phytophthora kernoviae]RLN77687.1 hypothetical protein BBO99_00006550 [Phytophthora kernoviae]